MPVNQAAQINQMQGGMGHQQAAIQQQQNQQNAVAMQAQMANNHQNTMQRIQMQSKIEADKALSEHLKAKAAIASDQATSLHTNFLKNEAKKARATEQHL
ncbi:hypothetical protein CS022_04215 [Veronia nyctiphanis]|uniref:Uncharacterized protein n=1 Tax=Veronia nyctiphanis TaxID=1278244 RepID=A0A4Q0YSQ1_9GAMM|nr:hypothetical protein [Veronia nyctiphanis]RXJ74270.1 hypothetical protein CS022_04215 [Veronia nyctiphanis]